MNLSEGKKLIKKKEFGTALKFLLKFEKKNTSDIRIYFYLGLVNFELNNFVITLTGVCIIAYNYLKLEGAIDDWQKRRPDTIAYREKFKGFMEAFQSNLGGQRTMDLGGQI